MIVYYGETLKDYLSESRDIGLKERFIAKNLDNYVHSPNDAMVCCLYGLRRTGKTVMMTQEIRKTEDFDRVLWILCESKDSMWDIRDEVKAHPECKYLYIDEITAVDDFINTCSFLANDYAYKGMKVIIAGTDSLGFFLAKNDELYGRVHLLHTTYIPYQEYHYLLNKDIMHYIEYGGTLTPENTFYNNDSLNQYSNSAIVENIVHSLKKWNQGRNPAFQIMGDIVEHNDLQTFISKVIEMNNREFVERIINSSFKSHDLGSLGDLMVKHDIADPSIIRSEEMSERARIFFNIKKETYSAADSDCVDTIIHYLEEMDVLFHAYCYEGGKRKEEYIFTQCGMRYGQATSLVDALTTSEEFNLFYSVAESKLIIKKLKEDICGGILEDIIFTQSAYTVANTPTLDKDNFIITKYRDLDNHEIDILIGNFETEKLIAIEVKLSSEQVETQCKHLLNDKLCQEIEAKIGFPIANKIVVYRGETGMSSFGNVLYINAEEFLCHTAELIELLSSQKLGDGEQVKKLIGKDCHKQKKSKFDYADE